MIRRGKCRQGFLVAHSVLESRHQGEDSLAYLVQVSTVCFKQIGNTENVELGYIQVIEENLICITSPVTRLSVLDVQNPTFVYKRAASRVDNTIDVLSLTTTFITPYLKARLCPSFSLFNSFLKCTIFSGREPDKFPLLRTFNPSLLVFTGETSRSLLCDSFLAQRPPSQK